MAAGCICVSIAGEVLPSGFGSTVAIGLSTPSGSMLLLGTPSGSLVAPVFATLPG
jgi:hypothetical protein